MDSMLTVILSQLISTIPQIIILLASIYFYYHKKNLTGLLLMIGSGIGLLVTIFYIFYTIFIQVSFQLAEISQLLVTVIIPIISMLGGFTFCAGFAIFVYNTVNSNKHP